MEDNWLPGVSVELDLLALLPNPRSGLRRLAGVGVGGSTGRSSSMEVTSETVRHRCTPHGGD